ncbi:hypothetical protein [Streptomyces sp. NPDC021224]|uniref:hypothetical protein n=1 Tax=unclassified Streptomyces TaxID=2593676 RepID=UPI0037BA5BCF
MREVDDRELAAYLTAVALGQIRALAGRARREGADPAEALSRIRFLADLCDNMPLGPRRRRPAGARRPSAYDRAVRERPMSYVWQVSGPEKREWMHREIERAGFRWTPPPPIPQPRPGPVGLSPRERAGLTSWPVRAPREARVLKALDGEALLALLGGTGERTAERSEHGVWLRAHVDLASQHFLYPDPASPRLPAVEGQWWCGALVRMADGEQVRTALRMRADDFRALPSTEPRLRQRRLVHVARATERDLGLWARDHDPVCGAGRCGPS